MAAGLTLRLSNFPHFAAAFDTVVRERIAPESLQPVLASDGELAPSEFDLNLARQLHRAGPWGQGFPAPVFDNVFVCLECRKIGADGAHRRLRLVDPRDGREHAAVWFGAMIDAPIDTPLRIAFELSINDWRGRESLQLLVRHCEPAQAGTEKARSRALPA